MNETKELGPVAQEIKRARGIAERMREAADALALLGEVDGADFAYTNMMWSLDRNIELHPVDGGSARTLALAVLARLKTLGRPPALATKMFDKDTGKIIFEIPGPADGWTIKVCGGEPRCKVKATKKQVLVPARPAYMSEQTVYEIENPEECGAEVR